MTTHTEDDPHDRYGQGRDDEAAGADIRIEPGTGPGRRKAKRAPRDRQRRETGRDR